MRNKRTQAPVSTLYCVRCRAPLGIRWKNRETGKFLDTKKWFNHPTNGAMCSPCYGESTTGNHSPRKRMHNKPLIGQLSFSDMGSQTGFESERDQEYERPAQPRRKQRFGA